MRQQVSERQLNPYNLRLHGALRLLSRQLGEVQRMGKAYQYPEGLDNLAPDVREMIEKEFAITFDTLYRRILTVLNEIDETQREADSQRR